MKRRSSFFATCVVLAVACSSVAVAEPEELLLQPSDVDVAYSAELRDDPPFIMGDCLIDNLGQRIEGAQTAAIGFDGRAAGDGFAHFVATTGERAPGDVFDDIGDLLGDCEPETSASVSADSIMTTTASRQLADGPSVGDKSLWISFTLDIGHTSGYSSDGDASPSVIFVKDGALHRLTAPVTLTWNEAVDFILEHADKL